MSEEELNEAMQYNLDYTEAMLSDELFGGNEVAEVKLLASEKEIKVLQQKVEQLEKENEQLRTQVNAYENPDDLTLFYMWLDEKAKDKIKQLENIRKEAIEFMKENCDIITIDEGWIIRCELTTTGLGRLFKILNEGDNNGRK